MNECCKATGRSRRASLVAAHLGGTVHSCRRCAVALQPANESEAIREFFTCLALCHTVLCEPDEKDPTILRYQAASPDEGALVSAAKNVGFRFIDKGPETMTIEVDGQRVRRPQ